MISGEELENFKKKDITDKTIIELENVLRTSISVITNYHVKKKFKSYMLAIRCLQDEIETLNNIIEKAVEYIKENESVDLYDDVGSEFIRNLLNILNGRSDE